MPLSISCRRVCRAPLSAVLILFALIFFCAGSSPAKQNIQSFAECISRSGATFYGAHWCPACASQNAKFGRSAHRLPYVECYEEGTRNKRRKCKDIRSFPTWVFGDGSQKTGALSFKTLSKRTDCPLP